MHPTDVFLKNTQEVLGPLNAATAYQRLTRLEFLKPDGSLRRAVYGKGDDAVEVVVNFGPADAEATTRFGPVALLPPWGFLVRTPRFLAFYAKSWGGHPYKDGALFTVTAAGSEGLASAKTLRVFHGFGEPTLLWGGKRFEVRREETVTLP
jgi:hypothetical protein